MFDLPFALAFTAGLVSFLSPCILPLIPGYLAYLSGASLAEATAKRKEMFLSSLSFVLGFTAVFSAVGVLLNTALEAVAYDAREWLARIGGIIIVFFGLYLTGIINWSFLKREFKIKINFKFKSHYLTSFLFGAAFAGGWTPCVGAVLGSILGLAATRPGSALSLLIAYSIGLGIPFLAVGLFAPQASAIIRRSQRWLKGTQIFFGVILIIIGILAFTQKLPLIANLDFLNQILPQ